jgi:hypothetical protein
MIGITITAEAYRAIGGAEPPQAALAPEGNGNSLRLEKRPRPLEPSARPPGESNSDVVLRMPKEEAA